ncbi:MAG: MFS transporter [Desulfocapsa sp.]|nr:MFS transporter [Desulfocapsa sp.]
MATENKSKQKNSPSTSSSLHYGWFIVVAGTLCVFASLGLGRFALGMLLPSMGEALDLSYSQMGFIGTANFIGYLVAILFCGRLSKQMGPRKLIGGSLLLVGLSMLMIGISSNLYIITSFYILTGMGSALANVSIMSLVPAWFVSSRRGRASGFVVIGSGFAIMLSGKLVPYLNNLHDNGWRISWCVLGLLVLASALTCYLIIHNRPEDKGLQPFGADSAPEHRASRLPAIEPAKKRSRLILQCAAIYFLFGFTYVIYATFIVTTLIEERGFSETVAGNFWSWVGFLSLFSGPVFGTLSDRFGRKAGLMLVFSVQTMAYLFIGLHLPDIFLYLSIGCYGIVAWSIPSIMSALISDYVGPGQTVSIFAFITFIFGLGQVAGPFIAGILAEISGSFTSSFLLASCMATLAVLLSLMLPQKIQLPTRDSGSLGA